MVFLSDNMYISRIAYVINVIILGYIITACYSQVHYINWSLATDKGHSHKERDYSHPAYNEIALSPCDLTEDSCDINCWSDKDCSEEQREGFDCFGGLQNGEKSESLTSYSCNHLSDTPQDGWFQLFCYVASNTPYLGKYFITPKKVENLSKFSDAAAYKKDVFDYHYGVSSDIDVSDERYKYGSPIKIVLIGKNIVQTKYLNIPANMFFPHGGMCVDEIPVRFLINRESRCVRSVSKKNCENTVGLYSLLSLQRYIVANYDSNDTIIHSQFPYVAKDGKGKNSTFSELKFLCFRNGSDYVTFSQNVFRINASKVLFSSQFHDDEYQFLSDYECTASEEELLNTSYDESEEVCRNVLISVNYDFSWNGTEIVKLLVKYIVADVPVTLSAFVKMKTESNTGSDLNASKLSDFILFNDKTGGQNNELYVTQTFLVSFRHLKDENLLTNNSTFSEEEIVAYSGNPGYEFGRPVIAVQSNGSEYNWEEVNLAIWGNAEGCKETKPVQFGYDILSACRLEIDMKDFEDCGSIRERVLYLQQQLIQGDLVSEGGVIRRSGTNITIFGELVPIIRLPIVNDSDDGVDGFCPDIPTRHVTDILYTTVAGPPPLRHPIHRICGVKARLDNINWTYDRIETRQTLFLESVVIFTHVPVMDEVPHSRFWEYMKSPEGSEIAWSNFFQIIELFETGDEVVEMSACFIMLSGCALALGFLLRHYL